MKTTTQIILLLVIQLIFSEYSRGQNICSTSKLFPTILDSTSLPENQTNDTTWYYFVAMETRVELDFYTILSSGNTNFSKIVLWQGSCGNLNQLAIAFPD